MPPKNARRLQLGHQTIRASKAHLFRASASPPNVVACPRGCPRVQSPSKKRVETLTRGSLGGSGLSPLCHDGCVFFLKLVAKSQKICTICSKLDEIDIQIGSTWFNLVICKKVAQLHSLRHSPTECWINLNQLLGSHGLHAEAVTCWRVGVAFGSSWVIERVPSSRHRSPLWFLVATFILIILRHEVAIFGISGRVLHSFHCLNVTPQPTRIFSCRDQWPALPWWASSSTTTGARWIKVFQNVFPWETWKKPVRSVVWYPSYPFIMIHDASWILSYSVLFHVDLIWFNPIPATEGVCLRSHGSRWQQVVMVVEPFRPTSPQTQWQAPLALPS